MICKIEHTGHHVISLNSYITEEKMEHIKDNLVQANNYLNGYYANLKDNCIKLLKEQIKRIQFAYEQSYNINNEILQLAHIMVDNYVPSCQNYYVMTNLINNTSFKFAKCEELDKKYSLNQNNINTLIKFFQTNVIVGNEEKGISPIVVKNSDFNIIIKMYGTMQSLNVSVATGILLFEARKQLEKKCK